MKKTNGRVNEGKLAKHGLNTPCHSLPSVSDIEAQNMHILGIPISK